MLQRHTLKPATLIKEKIYLGLGYSSEVSSIIILIGGMQAVLVLEKELRVLHLDPQSVEGVCVPHWA